ncbi:MAG: VOC family protein [Nitrososphaerales archaeon]
MINSIGGKIVMVSDQKSAVEFYIKKLGFDLRVDMPLGEMRWIEVAPKYSQSSISLVESDEKMMSKEKFEVAKKSIGTPTGIWFYTNDIKSTYEELKKNGVDVTKPEKQEWGGVMSQLKDQDGNSFTLIEFKM